MRGHHIPHTFTSLVPPKSSVRWEFCPNLQGEKIGAQTVFFHSTEMVKTMGWELNRSESQGWDEFSWHKCSWLNTANHTKTLEPLVTEMQARL